MKEKKLRIITLLMSLTVVGLISIQIYWINNAYSIEEIRFEEDMRQALRNVIKKLEKKEAARIVFEKFDKNKSGFIFRSGDSLNKFKWDENIFTKLPQRKLSVSIDSDIVNLSDKHFKIIRKISSDSVVDIKKINNKKIDSLIFGKQKLVTEVVEELISINPKTKNIFNNIIIDSLIKVELKSRQTDTNFAFGVFSPDQKIVFISNKMNETSLRKSKIRVPFFPNELFRPPDFLVMDFESKTYIIVKSISWILLLSILLIGLIIYLFYKTVKMFLLQKKVNDVKNDLINNITHEFKTPISTVSLACDLLNEKGSSPDFDEKYLNMIREENTKLSLLVENLLSIATLEKGELILNKTKFAIGVMLDKLTYKFNIIAEARGGKVSCENNFKNVELFADEFHLSSSISNVLDNAIKYSETNPQVLIKAQIKEGNISIEISDNGIGISKNDIKNIFDTFYRVPSGNIHNSRGNGIGLSYAKKIIELHDGSITVNSRLNEGSTFIITLPYEK